MTTQRRVRRWCWRPPEASIRSLVQQLFGLGLETVGGNRPPLAPEPHVADLRDGRGPEDRDTRPEERPGDDVGEPMRREVDPRERHHERERDRQPPPAPTPP